MFLQNICFLKQPLNYYFYVAELVFIAARPRDKDPIYVLLYGRNLLLRAFLKAPPYFITDYSFF